MKPKPADHNLLLPGVVDQFSLIAEDMIKDSVCMDTETSGLKSPVFCIEMSIQRPKHPDSHDSPELLYSSLFRLDRIPKFIEPDAMKTHKITYNDLMGAPGFADELPIILNIIGGRRVIAWNALTAEKRFIRETCGCLRIPEPAINWFDLMAFYAKWRGISSGRAKQSDASEFLGVIPGNHRADSDCRALCEILGRMARPPIGETAVAMEGFSGVHGYEDIAQPIGNFLIESGWRKTDAGWIDPKTRRPFPQEKALEKVWSDFKTPILTKEDLRSETSEPVSFGSGDFD